MDDMLFGVADDQAALIKELQPYLGGHVHREHKFALGAVAGLNNIDKHRFTHPVIGISLQGEMPTVERVSGPPPTDIEVVFNTGPLEPGAELMRWRIIGGTPHTKVTMKGSIPHDIAFGHPVVTLAHLDWIYERIGQVIERFSSAFPP
jgi:hypothetical protein